MEKTKEITSNNNKKPSHYELPDLSSFPKKQANPESARKTAKAIREEVISYVREYNVPFPVLR